MSYITEEDVKKKMEEIPESKNWSEQYIFSFGVGMHMGALDKKIHELEQKVAKLDGKLQAVDEVQNLMIDTLRLRDKW